ncbi:MAG: PilZ domain-containing protein [Candidatus Eremiobacteraeota bacterium]|nr:PilZ domain-containing protein [Candidatus Eremiobacteraeota bacterium]
MEATLVRNRRNTRRTRLEANLSYRHNRQDWRSAVATIEITVRGARAVLASDAKVGESLEISLEADGLSYYKCPARVAWSESLAGGKSLVGLEFLS